MTRAARIREWIAAQDGPQLSREIADGIGEDRMRVSWALNVMVRDGILGKVGEDFHGKRYFISRDVHVPLSAEERRERHNARRRKQCAAKRAPILQARAEALDRARAAVARIKARELTEKQARAKLPKPSKAVHRIAREMDVLRVTTPIVPIEPKQDVSADVAAWLAKGNEPEVLPGFYERNRGVSA